MRASDLATDPLLASFPVHEGYKVLGGVVLYQKLGQGGMGAVYRGKHLRLNVDVALKVMAPPEGMSPSHADNFVQRFIREAQTAASVRHQNLIRVYDVNTEGGSYYLVMDYIDGESAGDRLKRKGKLAEQEAVEIALGAADGLAEAHAQSIVHRDVKPDNILIDRKGAVVVADLGLAKAYTAGETDQERPGSTGSALSLGLSLTQQAMGTPYYMSPEQTRSAKDVGPAADVWSLGVTLYQLVSGELPWSDTDLVELLSSIRKDPVPDVRGRCPGITDGLSDGLCAIIERALNKDAAGRYADCSEMAKALSGHLDSIRQSSESALPDTEAGSTRMALATVTPPDLRTMTLIAEADVSPAPASQKAPAPPRAEAKWFHARGDRRQGPFTSKELQDLAARGVITPETLIWREGLAEWIPASRTKGLFTASSKFQSPPPLPGSQAPKEPPPLPGKPGGGETHGTEPAFSPTDGAVQGDLAGEAPHRGEEGRTPGTRKMVEQRERKEARRLAEREATRGHRRIGAGGRRTVGAVAFAKEHGTVLVAVAVIVAIGLLALGLAAGNRASRRRAEGDRISRAAAEEARLHKEKSRRDEERRREEERREEERRRAEEAKKAEATRLRRSAEEAEKRGDLEAAVQYYQKAGKFGVSVEGKVRSLQARMWADRGEAKGLKDDFDGAIRDCDQAIRLDPNCAFAYVVRGRAKSDKGDVSGAIRDCDRAIRLEPSSSVAYQIRAVAKESKGDLGGAIRDWDKAIQLDPRNEVAYALRGYAKAGKGDVSGAILDYDRAIQLDPDYAVAYAWRGWAKVGKGDRDGAIRDCDKAIRLDPNYAVAYGFRGGAKAGKGDFDGAIRDFDQAIRLNPSHAVAYAWRGEAKARKGDWDGAIRDYDQAIRLDPRYALAYAWRGIAKLDKGDLDGAIRDCDQAIRLIPNYALSYLSRGRAKAGKNDWSGAIWDFEKAQSLDRTIHLEPSDARAYRERGSARANAGDYDGAIRDCDRAMQLDPKHAEAYLYRGRAKVRKRDLDGAIRDFDKAIQLNPKDARAYSDRGALKSIRRGGQRDLRGALLDLNKAIRLDPNFGQAYANRAVVKKAMRDRLGAARDAAMARELGYTGGR